MKNTRFVLLISLATVIGLSACNVKNPADINKDLEKKLDEDIKKNDDILNQVKTAMKQGGQPGSIKVSGVIVKNNATTDVRITVVSKGGIGKDGTQAKTAEGSKPTLNSKNENLNLSKLEVQKNLISLGCDENIVSTYAKERSLEVQKAPAPITDGVLIISAKTIVLCGDMNKINANSSNGQIITFQSDELILDQVDYTLTGTNGYLSFNANKLLLQGSSQIATKGVASSMTLPLTPSLEFNVLKEISSNDEGKVLLMSVGSDYDADAK